MRNCSKFAPDEQEAFGDRYSELFLQARTRHLTDKELMEYFDSKISAYRERMIKEAAYDDGLRDGLRDGERKGREIGREEGRELGAAQRNAEIARAMLAKRMEMALVTKCTSLSEYQLKALQIS